MTTTGFLADLGVREQPGDVGSSGDDDVPATTQLTVTLAHALATFAVLRR